MFACKGEEGIVWGGLRGGILMKRELIWWVDVAGALDIPPFPADFESRCLLPGVSFLQDCTHLLDQSLEFFGIDKIERLTPEEEDKVLSKMDEFIESGLGKPDMG